MAPTKRDLASARANEAGEISSPLKRLREAKSRRNTARVEGITEWISTVEGVKAMVDSKLSVSKCGIRAMVLWVTDEMVHGRPLVRMQLTDADAVDKIDDMVKEYRAMYDEDRKCTEALLVCATIFDKESFHASVPVSGDVIKISKWTGLKIFNSTACQFTCKVEDIVREK